MRPVKPNTYIRRASSIVEVHAGDQLMLMHVADKRCFCLEEGALIIWSALKKPIQIESVIERMSEKFELTIEQCAGEVHTFLSELEVTGLIITSLEDHIPMEPQEQIALQFTTQDGCELISLPDTPYWSVCNGLLFCSELELPGHLPSRPGEPDVVVNLGPEAQQAWHSLPSKHIVTPGAMMTSSGPVINFPGVAHILVRGGCEIIATPAKNCDFDLLKLYLVGSSYGMLMHQRNLLPLHGATISHNNKALTFVGPSSEGKSTLAAHLCKLGSKLIADDVTVVTAKSDSTFQVRSGGNCLKLWRGNLERLGFERQHLKSVGGKLEKFYVPIGSIATDTAIPLNAIFLLEHQNGPAKIERLEAFEALTVVVEHVFRPEFVTLLGLEESLFQSCVNLSHSVPIFRLSRCKSYASLNEINVLLNDICD